MEENIVIDGRKELSKVKSNHASLELGTPSCINNMCEEATHIFGRVLMNTSKLIGVENTVPGCLKLVPGIITPPLGVRVLMCFLEWNLCKVDLANVMWGSPVFAMKFLDKVVGFNLISIHPGVLLIPKSFPGDQVLEFATEDATVHDFFNFPVFFAINDIWLGNFSVFSAWDRIVWHRE